MTLCLVSRSVNRKIDVFNTKQQRPGTTFPLLCWYCLTVVMPLVRHIIKSGFPQRTFEWSQLDQPVRVCFSHLLNHENGRADGCA